MERPYSSIVQGRPRDGLLSFLGFSKEFRRVGRTLLVLLYALGESANVREKREAVNAKAVQRFTQ